MMIEPYQSRAARGILDWTQATLAETAGLAKDTIINFENEKSVPNSSTLNKIHATLEKSGVEITANGVSRKNKQILEYTGKEGFWIFYTDFYETIRDYGGDIYLYNGVEKLFLPTIGDEGIKIQRKRMGEIKTPFNYRIFVEEGDNVFFGSSYAEYRWMPNDYFNDLTIFVYGTKVAIADFHDNVEVKVIDEARFAESLKHLFLLSWHNTARKPDEAARSS